MQFMIYDLINEKIPFYPYMLNVKNVNVPTKPEKGKCSYQDKQT